MGLLRFVLSGVEQNLGEVLLALDEVFDDAVRVGLQRAVERPLARTVEFLTFGLLRHCRGGAACSFDGVVEFLEVLCVVGAVQFAEHASCFGRGCQYIGVRGEKVLVFLMGRVVGARGVGEPAGRRTAVVQWRAQAR